MVNVIFIDDNYIYQNYPLPKRMDREALLSIITLEQVTSIQDLLGTTLYEDLEQKVFDENLTATELELFKLVKYSLCLYSVKAAATFLRSAVAKTKNEEKSTDSYSLDSITNAIDSKIQYINKRVVNYIKGDATLLAKAQESDNDLFNENDVYNNSVFYPTQPTINECE
tara:strand:+ start:6287 stop:6793 length:507 start_codon:yes stop_codon:yes gene_type:complete